MDGHRACDVQKEKMKFSEYTVTTKPGLMMDPLGFTQPQGALRNRLFRQFTVLSNYPAYHGLLTLAYQVLAERKVTPAKPGFSRTFRELEALWGMANVAAGGSVLNVTKYRAILEGREEVSLSGIPKRSAVFSSLAYGVLGHYASPSIVWGLLDKSGTHLTELGTALANAFAEHDGHSMRATLHAWMDNKNIPLTTLVALGHAYAVLGPAPTTEQDAWIRIIDAYCDRVPTVRDLWASPMSQDELGAFYTDAQHYQAFFPKLRIRYSRLGQELTLIETFERMAAIVQFVFEREYLVCQDGTGNSFEAGDIEAQLTQALGQLASGYMSTAGHQDTKGLFAKLAGVSAYADVSDIVKAHHVAHQKAKGVSPFMHDGELLVRDKFNKQGFTVLREAMADLREPKERLACLIFQYRREWHFERAIRYSRYAGGEA
jgi:hypothetical protein